MKLLRFLTDEEYEFFNEVFEDGELTFKANGYEYLNHDKISGEAIISHKEIFSILKEVVMEISKFNNFTPEGKVRIQYNYNYGMINMNQFYGVGYVTIKELHEGFEE